MKVFGRVAGWVAVAVLAGLLITLVVTAFGPLPGRVLGDSGTGMNPVERAKAESDVRGSLLQAVAGILLVIGAVTAWRQMLISRGQHLLSRRIAVTDAFIKAVEQLGNADSVARRMGGIYSLDRIAGDDPAEQPRISEILAAFVRERTAEAGPLAKDTMAALRVLTRRDWPGGVDLSGSRLAGVRLPGGRLRGAALRDTDLSGAVLTGSVLGRADLTGADLRRADLGGADLRDAALADARLSGAVTDDRTRWPAGFDASGQGVVRR